MLGILELIVIVLVLGAFIVGITFWITSGAKSQSNEMSCGGCGYAVRGLQALNCPECGADLRKVGINRHGAAGKRGLGIGLVIGSIVFILICMGLVGFLFTASRPAMVTPTSAPNPSLNQSKSSPNTTSSDIMTDDHDAAVEDAETDTPAP